MFNTEHKTVHLKMPGFCENKAKVCLNEQALVEEMGKLAS